MHTSTRDSRVAHLGQLMTAVALTAMLAACGGGGGSSPAPIPTPPAPVPAPTPAAPTPSPGDLAATVAPTTYASGSVQAAAYSTLNAARQAGGFGTVAQNAALDSEAQSQAEFSIAHYTLANSYGGFDYDPSITYEGGANHLDANGYETVHIQPASLSSATDYTGYLPSDRAMHFAYPSDGTNANVSESASNGGYSGNIDMGAFCATSLLASPGHRQLLLDPRYRDVGIGYDQVSENSAGTGETFGCYIATAAKSFNYGPTGQATAPTGWFGIYPPDGTKVSGVGDGHGHGFAPSITVDSHLTLTVNSFTITDGSGNVVPVTLGLDALPPGGLFSSNWGNWSVATPNAPLQQGTTYTVNFQGSAGGTAIAKVWTFTTP